MEICKTNYYRRNGAMILAYRKTPVKTESESLNALLDRIWEQIDGFAEQLSGNLSEIFDRYAAESRQWTRRELTVRMDCETVVRQRKTPTGTRFHPYATKRALGKTAIEDLCRHQKAERNPRSAVSGCAASDREPLQDCMTKNFSASKEPVKTENTALTDLCQKEVPPQPQRENAAGRGPDAAGTGKSPAGSSCKAPVFAARADRGVKTRGTVPTGKAMPEAGAAGTSTPEADASGGTRVKTPLGEKAPSYTDSGGLMVRGNAIKGKTESDAGSAAAIAPDTVTYIQVTVQSMYGIRNRPADGTGRLVFLWDTENGRCVKISG